MNKSIETLFSHKDFLHKNIANFEKTHNVKIFQDNFEEKIMELINTSNSVKSYKPAFINQLNQLKSGVSKTKSKSKSKSKSFRLNNKGSNIIMKKNGKRKRKTIKGGQWRNYIKNIIASLFAMAFIQIINTEQKINVLLIIIGLFYIGTRVISGSLIFTVEIVDMAKNYITRFIITHFSDNPELSRPTDAEIRDIIDSLFIDNNNDNSDNANLIVAKLLDTIALPTPVVVAEILENTAINRYCAENAVALKQWDDKHIEDPADDVYAERCAYDYHNLGP